VRSPLDAATAVNARVDDDEVLICAFEYVDLITALTV